MVAPNSDAMTPDMSEDEFSEYRVENMIPHQGHEITPSVHPLACGLGNLVHEAKVATSDKKYLLECAAGDAKGKLVRLPNPVDNATTTGKLTP